MNKQIEKEIEYLRFAMREPCGCKVCEDERANIGDNCVIRQALTQAHQAGIDEAVEIINEALRNAPLEVQMTKGIIFGKVIKALQDNK